MYPLVRRAVVLATAFAYDALRLKQRGKICKMRCRCIYGTGMVAEFADAAFAGNKGDILGPIATKFGFHIIEVEDKRDSVPVDEVKDKIKTQLRDEVVKAYIEEMKAGATIVEPGAATGGATVTETKPAGEAKPEDKPATPPPN